tara:strand:+ start:2075 stop:2434 length:360 start_codon:yes stop_codon:yes gene_type:complete
MKVLKIDKKLELSLHDIIRFQITTYCFINSIKISPAQMDTLAYLGEWGEMNISDFCDEVVLKEVFGNSQTVRNFITKCVKDGYVLRYGKGNKLISLTEKVELLSEGNILIDMKVYHVES